MGKQIIAITGGIGSGKSLAAKFLKEKGYKVVSCDEITRNLYEKRKIKRRIAEIFPSAAKGKIFIKIDKKAVAEEVFKDDVKRQKLNAFLHPIIIGCAIKSAKKGKGGVAFVEIPLLFETESQQKFDGIIVITRPIDERIAAVEKRSALSKEDVIKRIKAQFDYDGADLTDYTVIENTLSKQAFKDALLSAIEKLK